MSNKSAAAYHGVPCGGECCRQNRHLGVCFHGHACRYHIAEQMKEDRAALEAFSIEESKRMGEFKGWR